MSKKLLLADDSITIQKVIGITFVNEDYELTVVDNGTAALEKASEVHPDLILADVFMPGKNGYELCSAIKQDPALGRTPVLLLAGTFEPFDEEKAAAAGADGWIAKPFESQALIDRVEQLLAKAAEQPAVPTAPTPAAVPDAEVPASAARAVKSDLWEEIEEQAPSAAAADAGQDAIAWDEAFASEGGAGEEADDIWSEVTFEEEDLLEEPAAPAMAGAIQARGAAPAGVEATLEEAFAPETEDLDDLIFEEEPEAGEPGEIESEEAFIFEEVEGQVEAAEEESFIFDEEPLTAEAEEEIFILEEEPEAVGEEELLVLEDEDILPLDEEDILEEVDLEPAGAAVASEVTASADASLADFGEEDLLVEEEELTIGEDLSSAGLEEVVGFEEPAGLEEPSFEAEEPVAFDEPVVDAEAPVAFDEPMVDAEAPVAFDEPMVEVEAPVAFDEPVVEAEEPVAFDEPVVEAEEVAAVVSPAVFPAAGQAGAAPSAPVTAAAAQEKVQGLSEEELTEIVERVAGSVIERLAGSILEKIAWEVVPDLAESMIKEEIRKIKEMAGQA
ncbi:hypothetical protein DESUT3_14700 [Desulfuromonas versatilis]|uniref:Response regulatory domain-containing protein n=1 Tax=Desulfuromonas versatilis TaxID=2802975 RepID=A0ABM8HQG9_9BACT|nr:response regulator [Desulfuromonas versatilis]BCR04401.1 hypothetical protein DESUT3_14700 [Desulfuromonas versatilis]